MTATPEQIAAADAAYETSMNAIDAEFEAAERATRGRDINAYKAAESKFRTAQAEAQHAYNAAIGHNYYVFDANGEYVDINPRP